MMKHKFGISKKVFWLGCRSFRGETKQSSEKRKGTRDLTDEVKSLFFLF
jgi:hypothetical protein